jgi:IclR family transcriptional regulator, acetate operon repressor
MRGMDTRADRLRPEDARATGWRVPSKADLRAAGQVQSLSRALKLLNALSQHPRGLRLSGIARLVGLPPSTAHRLLTTLQTERYVRFAGNSGVWQIGAQAFRVGATFVARDLAATARPFLTRLAAAAGELASLVIADLGELVVIDAVGSHGNLLSAADAAGRPLPETAGGRALLAADRGRQALDGERWLAEARERGYAIAPEDHAGERIGIAAAITGDHGQAVAALVLSAPARRTTPARCQDLGAVVLVMTREIAAEAKGKFPS